MQQLNNISDLEIPISVNNETHIDTDREQFHTARNGLWSGTIIKRLMACNKKGGKMQWSDPDKYFEFSDGIVKLIYSRCMQRKTKNWIETKPTAEMRYGTRVEPLILALGAEFIPLDIEEVKFKAFADFPTAGATADSVGKKEGKVKAVVEAKGCTSWETHFNRTFNRMDEKDIDFWQTQTEMRAWEVDLCYYLVASPPRDMYKYLNYDGDIMDLKEDFRKECIISVEEVVASPFHQKAIMERVIFAESVVDKWMEVGGHIKELFDKMLDEKKGVLAVDSVEVIDHIEETTEGVMLNNGEEIAKEFDPLDLPF